MAERPSVEEFEAHLDSFARWNQLLGNAANAKSAALREGQALGEREVLVAMYRAALEAK